LKKDLINPVQEKGGINPVQEKRNGKSGGRKCKKAGKAISKPF
jgi:hypothetical protein